MTVDFLYDLFYPHTSPQNLALPDICSGIVEHVIQSLLQLFLRNVFLQDYLKESAASGAADHFSIDEVFDHGEDLVDAGVCASSIEFLGEFPVF